MIDEYTLIHLTANTIFYHSISQKGKKYMPVLFAYFLIKLSVYIYTTNKTELSSDTVLLINVILGVALATII